MNSFSKRIFIAYRVNAGQEILDCLTTLRESLKEDKIKWVDKDKLHITLSFIGDTEAERINEVGKIMEKNVPLYTHPEMIIKGMGVFRSITNPRVIWLGMDPIPELAKLKGKMDKELREAGFPVEQKQFRPHLTLGRIKWLNDKSLLADMIGKHHNRLYQVDRIDEMVLFESVLRSEGPQYLPLKVVRFKYDGL